MYLFRKLAWFMKLEKRRYLIGIIALILVSIFNLIPPKVIGTVIDKIEAGNLTNGQLFLNVGYLVLAALAMYALRYIWRVYIFGAAYNLGRILRSRLFEHFTKMSPSFFQKYRTGDLMAHATNDINSVAMVAGGGVMSAVDASITALVTLFTMIFLIDFKLTLIAIIPLPFLAYATNYIGDKNYESFEAAQESFSDLNNKVQESASGIKVTKSFGYGNDEIKSFREVNNKVFGKNVIAAGESSIAAGLGAKATGQDAISLGRYSVASGGQSVSFGNGAVATDKYAIAIGKSVTATAQGAVAIGEALTSSNDFPW